MTYQVELRRRSSWGTAVFQGSVLIVALDWARLGQTPTITAGGRARFLCGNVPTGSTLERLIFGFMLWNHVFWGGDSPLPGSLAITAGVLCVDNGVAAPDIDPESSPTSDWIWTGLIVAEVVPQHSSSIQDYRLRYSTPTVQLESGSRRINPFANSMRPLILTTPLEVSPHYNVAWQGRSYASTLYST